MRVLVSACLIGDNCKYSGGNNRSMKVLRSITGQEVIPVCPEMLGGLPVPRPKAEIRNGEVVFETGESADEAFRLGAEKVLEIAKKYRPDLCILQPRSPSCGKGKVYDGTFSGTLVDGDGVAAKLLMENGFKVVSADELEDR
ncbi:MAG: DUF523 domain-containing protein [Clostridia bacterium]|nr:DUF523 domain-containing protein [Clostridia bacterium]